MERSTIHLLHKRGKSQRQIARELGYSRATVARALREPVAKPPSRRRRGSQVDVYRPKIDEWVRAGLSSVRMLELARMDAVHPYIGGRSVFGEVVRQVRQEQERASADVPVRFEGLPGEYLQVDWGEVRAFPFTQQAPATRYFLACRLKYSRWSWLCWTSDMRQETLLRGLIDCFGALGWVPWVLVFDNMKTVTSGRDAAGQAIGHPTLLQIAAEFGFHPEACAIAAANQKGSVESLVKWVKGNFLAGRSFADDADLAEQAAGWSDYANARPSSATGEPPEMRLRTEATKGGVLPPTVRDYGFLFSGQANAEALVAVEGNVYSVPAADARRPVTVRLHRAQVVIWRDLTCIATHPRAPDGARQRVIEPAHFAPLFPQKPRAQVMLYREALLGLGQNATEYLSEVSRRRRDGLRTEILGAYALWERHGTAALLAAMELAADAGAYGVEYLDALLAVPPVAAHAARFSLPLPGIPHQTEVDRLLSSYEAWVTLSEVAL